MISSSCSAFDASYKRTVQWLRTPAHARPGRSPDLYSSSADRHETFTRRKKESCCLEVYLLSLSVQFYIRSRSILFSTRLFAFKKPFPGHVPAKDPTLSTYFAQEHTGVSSVWWDGMHLQYLPGVYPVKNLRQYLTFLYTIRTGMIANNACIKNRCWWPAYPGCSWNALMNVIDAFMPLLCSSQKFIGQSKMNH